MFFSSSKNFDFYQFQKFLVKHQIRGTLPSMNDWPNKISLTPDVWSSIRKIKDYTKQEGRERSTSLFVANGDIVTTPYVRGKESRVSSKHKVTLRYEPTHRKNWYEKILFLDGNIYKKYTISKDKVPKKPEVHYLFNIHTHPPHKTESGKIYYNHISETDMNGLLSGKSLCMGLAIDKFWLVCKTNDSTFTKDLNKYSREFTLKNNYEEFCNYLKDNNIVAYLGKYGGKLIKQ